MENKKIKHLKDEVVKEETDILIPPSPLRYSNLVAPNVQPNGEQNNCIISETSDDSSLKIWQKRRYLIAIFVYGGYVIIQALRINLSIAVISMTENKSVTLENGTIAYSKEFDWDSKQQGFILSSFFYGYICTQVVGGWLAAKYGGGKLFGIGIAVTSALTILTPCAAKQSFYLLIFVRLTEGLFEGVTYPCVLDVWSRWAPPMERSRLVSTSIAGGFPGIIIAMSASAYLSDAFGWESIFYVFGSIGIIWYIGWLFIIPESPFQDKHIKREELQYLKLTLGDHNHNRNIKPPWKSILKSPPVWAAAIADFTENWGYYTFLTQLPKFLKDTLHFELQKAGISSAVPYLAMGVALPLAGCLADWLQVKKIFTTTQVRKLFTCGAFLSQTVFMLTATYLLSPIGTIACITTAVGLGGFAWAAFIVNCLDIASPYASILTGIGATMGTLPGILSPTISGYIVVTPTSKEWQIVFFITSGVYLVGAILYFTFGSGEVQKWAMENQNNDYVHQDNSSKN